MKKAIVIREDGTKQYFDNKEQAEQYVNRPRKRTPKRVNPVVVIKEVDSWAI